MIQNAASVGRQVPNHMKRSYVAVVTHQRIVRIELKLQLYLDEREIQLIIIWYAYAMYG